jgi:hypothetical protein
MPEASLVVRNARIYTLDRSLPWADALAIQGDRIAWVGRDYEADDWIGPNTKVIEAGKRLVLPGLIDSHFHLLLGARGLHGVQLDDAKSVEEIQQQVRAFAQAHPDREWITGRGWQYKALPEGVAVHRKMLDEVVPDRPVVLTAFDGHTAWANTVALERAGLLNGPSAQPAFGAVIMGDDGAATGELRETVAMNLVRSHVPELTAAEQDALLRRALKMAASYGITSVHNMDGQHDALSVFHRFDAHAELTLRVYVPFDVEPGMKEDALEAWVHSPNANSQSPLVRTGAMKFFADGVVESKTAWMLEPYADGSDDRGKPNFDPEEFKRLVVKADYLRQQVFVHAIGDAAARLALDAFNHAIRMNGPRSSRHRIEHVEVLDPADLTRFKRMHALASVQPLHADFGTDDANPWRKLVGPRRWAWGFPWRTLMNAGVPLAFGSDWPVVTMNPFEGMRAGLARHKLDFSDAKSHFPDQKLTLEELIEGYTRAGAYFEFQEREKGQIKAGMLADVIALDQNWFDALPEELSGVIGDTRSALTIVGGRIVHEAM